MERQKAALKPASLALRAGIDGFFTDNPAMGPNQAVTARFVEDNPGRWMYHCHVFSHQDAGMTGWYVVEP